LANFKIWYCWLTVLLFPILKTLFDSMYFFKFLKIWYHYGLRLTWLVLFIWIKVFIWEVVIIQIFWFIFAIWFHRFIKSSALWSSYSLGLWFAAIALLFKNLLLHLHLLELFAFHWRSIDLTNFLRWLTKGIFGWNLNFWICFFQIWRREFSFVLLINGEVNVLLPHLGIRF